MPTLPDFETLFTQADQISSRVPVVAAGGNDPTVISALGEAQKRGWVSPVLVGPAQEITEIAKRFEVDLNDLEILDSQHPSIDAVAKVKEYKHALLMKGQIPTPDLLSAVLNSQNGIRTGRVVCQMVYMEIKRDKKVFLMTDTGITISPTLSQKADLLMHGIETCELLGLKHAKVAVMSATEKVNAALPDTLDASKLCEQAASGHFGPCDVAGPLSFDLAYASTAGERKKMESPVIGQADVMVFPDLLSANLTVKSMMYTSDCAFGGVLCGTTVPVVFMSRADDAITRLRSLAFALAISEESHKN